MNISDNEGEASEQEKPQQVEKETGGEPQFNFRNSRFLDKLLLQNNRDEISRGTVSVSQSNQEERGQVVPYVSPDQTVELSGAGKYLKQKMESLMRTKLSLREYSCGLMAHLQHITNLREHVEREEERLKAQRTRQRAPLVHGFVGSPALEEFYKYDRPESEISRGLEVMKLIERRRKLEQNKQVSLGDMMVSSSSESEDDAEDMPRAKHQHGYDFENRKTHAWKNDDDDEDFENYDSGMSPEAKMDASQDGSSSVAAAEYIGKRAPTEFNPHQTTNDQLLSSIVIEAELKPTNIRKHNLAELATKKNTVKHLQTTNVPIKGLEIYKAYMKWHGINRKPQEWSAEENTKLASLVEVFSDTRWKQISVLMDGRTPYECRRQWFQKVSPLRQVVRWDNPVDDLLIGLGVLEWSKGKRVKWAKVAGLFNGRRNEVQVRERYANILDPGLGALTSEDCIEDRVMAVYDQIGNKWSKIARQFPGYTDNQVKRIVERALRKKDEATKSESDESSSSK